MVAAVCSSLLYFPRCNRVSVKRRPYACINPPTSFVVPGSNICSQARKFVRTVPMISCSCWTPITRSSLLYHLVDIRNPSVLEEAEELEPELVRGPWLFGRWWRGLDWLWREGVRIRDWSKQRAATAGLGNVRKFWRRTKGLCVVRRQCLIASLSSETRSSPPAFLDIGDNPVREEVPLPWTGICFYSLFLFCKFFININISSFLGQNRFSGTTLHILTLRYKKITWQALEPNLGRGWGDDCQISVAQWELQWLPGDPTRPIADGPSEWGVTQAVPCCVCSSKCHSADSMVDPGHAGFFNPCCRPHPNFLLN